MRRCESQAEAFGVKQQFLGDLGRYCDVAQLRQLDRALLVFRSPFDRMVSIDEAAKIYQAARHPKIFISCALKTQVRFALW